MSTVEPRIHIALGVPDIAVAVTAYTEQLGCAPEVLVPGEYALCGALADRIELWRSLRKSAEEGEEQEHMYLFNEQLRPYTEIGEMAELLDGLGDDLGAVAAQLRAHGLGALDLGQMARLLRLLCEQALMAAPTLEGLKTAREVHGAAGLEQWLGTGAAGSGKDAPSTGLVYLPQLRRVYSMSCAPPGKSPAWVPHMVHAAAASSAPATMRVGWTSKSGAPA